MSSCPKVCNVFLPCCIFQSNCRPCPIDVQCTGDPDSWDLIAFLMFSSLTSTISSPNVTNIVVAAATMSDLGVLVLITLASFRFFGASSLLSTCTRLDLDLLGLFSPGLEDAAFGAASDVAFVLGGFLSFSFAFEACSDLALVLGAALGFSLVLGAVFNF